MARNRFIGKPYPVKVWVSQKDGALIKALRWVSRYQLLIAIVLVIGFALFVGITFKGVENGYTPF